MRDRKTAVKNRLAQLEAELALLEQMPDEDFEDGAVVRWSKTTTDEKTYTYVALFVDGFWYLTGRRVSASEYRMNMETLWTRHLMTADSESVVVLKVDRKLLT